MIPNFLADVQAAKTTYPDAWNHAHVDGDPKRWDFIRLLARDLHAKDVMVGLNGKRGNANDLSQDALNYLCEAVDSSGRTPEGLPCAVIDCIGAAGTPAAVPAWTVFATKVEGSGAWVMPGVVPVPSPGCVFPPRDQGLLFFTALDEKYRVRGYPQTLYFVDREGTSVWYAEYLRHRTAGLDHLQAQAKVFADIDKVWNP